MNRSSAIAGAPLASGPETPDGFKGQNKTKIEFRRPNPVGDFLGALASPLDGEMAPLAWVEHIDGVTMDEMEVEAVVIAEVTNDEMQIRGHEGRGDPSRFHTPPLTRTRGKRQQRSLGGSHQRRPRLDCWSTCCSAVLGLKVKTGEVLAQGLTIH